MIRTAPEPQWKTPPQAAKQLAVAAEKVLGFIAAGELVAVNVANAGSTRPRWRIDPAELEVFLLRRRNGKPAVKPRRRKAAAEVIQFF